MDLEKEYLQQRAELLEANAQALRELQKQEFIIRSYIPDDYLVSAFVRSRSEPAATPAQKLIQENATWSEQFGEWNMRAIAYTGNNMQNKERAKKPEVRTAMRTISPNGIVV